MRTNISTHERTGASCDLWSRWYPQKSDRVTGDRYYIVAIYDGCDNNNQVLTANPKCANDANIQPGIPPSYCIDITSGHMPVGLNPQTCMAGASQYVLLNANVSPASFENATGATLTATTSFGSGNRSFTDQLSEAFCTDILNWNVMAWTFRWSDGTTQNYPGAGQNTQSATDIVAPNPTNPGPASESVTVVAHLHIQGTALDFDPNGNIFTRTVDTYVDISTQAGANSAGLAPTYTPPQLQVGGIAFDQNSDGSMPPFDGSLSPSHHLDTIRGRLLRVYPRAVVVSPGTESIGGVTIGIATTTTLNWQYRGGFTDAPLSEQTLPGTAGTFAAPLQVQWNHAELIGPSGQLIDEQVPITITARTVYPDGHTETETLNDSIPVTIYYIGLNYSQ